MKAIKTGGRERRKEVKGASQRPPTPVFSRSNTEAHKELFVQRSHSQQVGDSNSRLPTPGLGPCAFPGAKRQRHDQGTVLGVSRTRQRTGGVSVAADHSHPKAALGGADLPLD